MLQVIKKPALGGLSGEAMELTDFMLIKAGVVLAVVFVYRFVRGWRLGY